MLKSTINTQKSSNLNGEDYEPGCLLWVSRPWAEGFGCGDGKKGLGRDSGWTGERKSQLRP